MKPRVGIFINNRTTAGLARRFLLCGIELPYEPVFLVPSTSFKDEVHGDSFDRFEFRIIGCDFPWRKEKRFRIWTWFYLRSFLAVRSDRAFSGLKALVVFKDDGTLDRVLVLKARRVQMPVICIQEEAIYERTDKQRESGWGSSLLDAIADRIEAVIDPNLPGGKTVEKGMLSSINIVYGEKKRDRLIARGYPAEQVFVLGHPFYDGLRICEPPSEPPHKILFAHQQTFDNLDNEFDWYEAMVDAAEAVGARFEFKLHPRSKTKAEDILSRFGSNNWVGIGQPGDIQASGLDCGLFVTGDSAAVNRALGDGVVPLLLNGANPAGRRLDLADIGAAIEAWTPSQARGAIIAFYKDPEIRRRCLMHRSEAIRAHLGPLDGGAADRYNQKILEVAQGFEPK